MTVKSIVASVGTKAASDIEKINAALSELDLDITSLYKTNVFDPINQLNIAISYKSDEDIYYRK
jgi:hypothetical protein